MEVISAGVLSAFLYDMLKHQITINAANLKSRLHDWVVDEVSAQRIAEEVKRLGLTNQMSESAIAERLNSSTEILSLVEAIKPANLTIIQTHQGNGDNVAGNKVIHRS